MRCSMWPLLQATSVAERDVPLPYAGTRSAITIPLGDIAAMHKEPSHRRDAIMPQNDISTYCFSTSKSDVGRHSKKDMIRTEEMKTHLSCRIATTPSLK
jgi:hypothetical protein